MFSGGCALYQLSGDFSSLMRCKYLVEPVELDRQGYITSTLSTYLLHVCDFLVTARDSNPMLILGCTVASGIVLMMCSRLSKSLPYEYFMSLSMQVAEVDDLYCLYQSCSKFAFKVVQPMVRCFKSFELGCVRCPICKFGWKFLFLVVIW